MKTLSIRNFRSSLAHLDQLVEKAGEIIITRHGKPILRILPVYAKRERPDHTGLRSQMPLLKTPSSEIIRQDRDER